MSPEFGGFIIYAAVMWILLASIRCEQERSGK